MTSSLVTGAREEVDSLYRDSCQRKTFHPIFWFETIDNDCDLIWHLLANMLGLVNQIAQGGFSRHGASYIGLQ